MPRSHLLTAQEKTALKAERTDGLRRNAAFGEAGRLQSIFAATAEARETPARPRAVLFSEFGAFQTAYGGRGAYERALNDLYGADGNVSHLAANRTRKDLDGNIIGDKALYAEYNVDPESVVALFDKMSFRHRESFYINFGDFVTQVLPYLHETMPSLAQRVLEPLATIDVAMRHGGGALAARNFDTLLRDSTKMIMDCMGDTAHRRVDLSKEGPSW